MTDQRLKVQSGPPQHMIDEPVEGAQPPSGDGAGGGTAEQAKRMASEAKGKAQEVAGQAKEQAQQAASQAKDQAAARVDERTTQLGQQVGGQAQALDGVAGQLREQGKEGPARVAEQASQRVQDAGRFLEQADGEQLVDKAQQIARENPAAAAAVGAAAGFVAGRVIKASSPDDAQGSPPPAPADSAPEGP
jgi:cell division septum initiation protein DivIVA